MATYKIKTKRYIRKYTAAEKLPVSAALIDAQRVVDELCNVPWELSAETTSVITSHDERELDANVSNRDRFDAALFCADHANGSHRAYANAACYKIPFPAGTSGKKITSLKVRVTSDAYNAAGARIALVTNSTGVIPTACSECRGEGAGGIHAAGVAPQTIQTVGGQRYGYPTIADCSFNVSPGEGEYALPTGGLTLGSYLYVFVIMENYNSVRGNWLEGSSCIVNQIEIVTDSAITGWTDGALIDLTADTTKEFNVCRDGVLPVLSSGRTGVKSITLQRNGDEFSKLNPGLRTGNALCTLGSVIAELDGPITSISIQQPFGFKTGQIEGMYYLSAGQYAVITGKFSRGTFDGLPGFIIYDVTRNKILENVQLPRIQTEILIEAREGRLKGGYVHNNSSPEKGVMRLNVFAILDEGAFINANDSSVAAFCYIDISQESGSVASCDVYTVRYRKELNIDTIVQCAYTDDTWWYDNIEYVYLSGGKILGRNGRLPSSGIPYAGTITAIRPLQGAVGSETKFLISGDLSSVGGTPCKNCAIVTFTTSTYSVVVPTFDSQITPDTYEAFCVSAGLNVVTKNTDQEIRHSWDDTDAYIVTGAFNSLSGDSALRRAVKIKGSSISQITDLADVANVVGAGFSESGFFIYATGKSVSASHEVYGLSSLNTDVTDEQSCIGLRSLYAKLFGSGLHEVPTDVIGSSVRTGAGFVVRTGSVQVNSVSGSSYSKVTVPTWQMSLAYLTVPFSVPQDFLASGIRLAWPALEATGGKLNVWLKRGEYVVEVPELSDPSFFTADKISVDGWELVGCVAPTESSVTFKVDHLSGRVASLLFTAFISLDDLNPSDEMTMPQGVCTAMDVDLISGTVSGISSNWKPDITLIG